MWMVFSDEEYFVLFTTQICLLCKKSKKKCIGCLNNDVDENVSIYNTTLARILDHVFGVVSFQRCVLGTPPCKRGGFLVVSCQSLLNRHNKSKGLQYIRSLPPCVSGVLACLHAGLVKRECLPHKHHLGFI